MEDRFGNYKALSKCWLLLFRSLFPPFVIQTDGGAEDLKSCRLPLTNPHPSVGSTLSALKLQWLLSVFDFQISMDILKFLYSR